MKWMNSYLWQGNSELRNQPLTKQSTTSVLHCHKDEYLCITSTAILFRPFSRHHEERAKQRQRGQQKTQRTCPAHTRQQCQNTSARSLNAHMKRKTSKMNSLPCCYRSTQLAYTLLHRRALHGQPPKSKRSDDPQYLLRDPARNGHIF